MKCKNYKNKKSFTLVELMIVIAILAILSAIVIFTLNPGRLFDNFRDTRRVTDITSIHKAINFMETWNTSMNYGDPNTIYLSLPDSNATCSSYSLPTLATGYSYSCKTIDDFRKTDGNGWIPINFEVGSSNRYLSSLPVDPVNDGSYFYSYFPGGSYELIARLKNSRADLVNEGGFSDNILVVGTPNRNNFTPLPRNLILNGAMETTENWIGFTSVETQDFYEGSASLKRTGNTEGWSVNHVKVDPEKRYRLSGCFKSVGSGGLSSVYFGLQSYDSKFRSIGPSFSNSIVASRTILSKNLLTGDLTVEVDDASGWTVTPNYYRYLAVYPFEQYPDYTYTRNSYYYASIDYENNVVTLQNPYDGPNLPAGTKISQSSSGYGTYTYSVIRGGNIPVQWTCYSSEIHGQNVPVAGWDQFRYGTEYIKILMLLNYGQSGNYSVLVDNVKFELIANE